MYASEIFRIVKTVESFGGIMSSDMLDMCKPNKFYIVNSDPSNKPGKHWFCVYLTSVPEFFDSLGHSPTYYSKDIERLLIQNGPDYIYNSQRLQNYDSILCGQYCIYYIIMRAMGYSINGIVNNFSKTHLKCNDQSIITFMNELF